MSSTLPRGTIIEIRGVTGKYPIKVTLDENVHFTPVHSDTAEQETNQLIVAGLAAMVELPFFRLN